MNILFSFWKVRGEKNCLTYSCEATLHLPSIWGRYVLVLRGAEPDAFLTGLSERVAFLSALIRFHPQVPQAYCSPVGKKRALQSVTRELGENEECMCVSVVFNIANNLFFGICFSLTKPYFPPWPFWGSSCWNYFTVCIRNLQPCQLLLHL